MHLPYTDNYPEAVAIAADCVAASLTARVWSRPLPGRASNALFVAGVWTVALFASKSAIRAALTLPSLPGAEGWLMVGTGLSVLALVLARYYAFACLSLLGVWLLALVGSWVVGSEHELMFLHLFWHGALLGVHALMADSVLGRVFARAPSSSEADLPAARSFWIQDALIFACVVALAAKVTNDVFERVVYNGDEVANTFQADVYGHFRAYAKVPPCPSMFENYWVFRYQGRVFSQYTPGWPLFMALFSRLKLIWLAGPVMAGLVAVGVARLSRRLSRGLGATSASSARVVAVAGPLGAACALLGPAMLLNGASRFSHTMVVGCFAWAVECCAVVTTLGIGRGRAVAYGLLLGAATSLGLATRPADGGFLGIGVFLYFTRALWLRRVTVPAFLGTCAGFLFFGGLTAVILRLQLGEWFKTGYAVTPLFHPEGRLVLSLPAPGELKYGIPLAAGSYCWWPSAPALGVIGLVRALGGRERRVALMLAVSTLALLGFYSLVAFGRGSDDGLGPRYTLPVVVALATGTAAALAPAVARVLGLLRGLALFSPRRLRDLAPGVLLLASGAYGVARLAPLTYPVAYAENHWSTAALRAAKAAKLTNAVVLLFPNETPAGWWNIAQNSPMDPSPDVLFLSRRSATDEACARRAFPGRAWYRARANGKLEPYPGRTTP